MRGTGNNNSYQICFLLDQKNDLLRLKIDGVTADMVNISWNEDEFLKNGVSQILLVAEPSGAPTPIGRAVVNTSASKGSIASNLIPSTRYMIYIVELSKSNKTHLIHYVTTKNGCKLNICRKLTYEFY